MDEPRISRALPVLSLALLLLAAPTAFAQPDSTGVLLVRDTTDLPAPKTALRRSLIVPGWGQVTNGDYVKAGIAVGGVSAAATYAVVYGLRTVRFRRAAIFADCEAGTTVPEGTCDGSEAFRDEWLEAGSLTGSQNRALRDNARRNRDFMILITGLAYALQSLDAFVSAHLAGFDVGEDLSLHLAPTPTGPSAALRWTF